jgi:hypothetical protein
LIVCIEQKRNWRTSNPGKDCKGWVNLSGLIWMFKILRIVNCPKNWPYPFYLMGLVAYKYTSHFQKHHYCKSNLKPKGKIILA